MDDSLPEDLDTEFTSIEDLVLSTCLRSPAQCFESFIREL